MNRMPIIAAILLAAWLCVGKNASAGNAVEINDCPAAPKQYSLAMPLSDLVRSQRIVDLIANIDSTVASRLARPFGDAPLDPNFGNIISGEFLLHSGMIKADEHTLSRIESELRQTNLTVEEKQLNCQRYDNQRPALPSFTQSKRILVFRKVNGFRHSEALVASEPLYRRLAAKHGYDIYVTDLAGVFNSEDLAQFNVIVWDNISGDALTYSQRAQLKSFIENGGGFVAVHGAGGDLQYFWDWYADAVIGARFTGHPMAPQFQQATLYTHNTHSQLAQNLPAKWEMEEEWYSFEQSPRHHNATILVTLDESSYDPVGFGGQSLAMGDHPIAWAHCVGEGRVFYSAIGHRAESFEHPTAVQVLENGLLWASTGQQQACSDNLKRRQGGGE